ncbi:MAG: type 11 methyltransferase, partial [Caulobacteraceae bacterium]
LVRVVEPELMDGDAQSEAYARADFAGPNELFCRELAARIPAIADARVVDLGCGPADIPIRLARAHPGWRLDAVDGAAAMLRHARHAIDAARLGGKIALHHARLPDVPLPDHVFDLAISNSLLHHLHAPEVLWREIVRLGRAGATVAVMDLVRPDNTHQVRAIVDRYAADEPEVLREDFCNSLCAAFTPAEVRSQLVVAGLGHFTVEPISDRHLFVCGVL